MAAAEEIQDAQRVIPLSMIVSILFNGAGGFAMLLALVFCLQGTNAAINSPTGFPFVEILVAGTNSIGGGTALVSTLKKPPSVRESRVYSLLWATISGTID